jgi:hypothetical protein
VTFHDLELVPRQLAGLEQDGIADADLADIMQKGADNQVINFSRESPIASLSRNAYNALPLTVFCSGSFIF